MPITLPPTGERQGSEVLYREVYLEVREAILSGRWASGTRLPSTRQLAADLDISRTTAVAAFDLLLAEGYVEGVAGSGTFVARILPDATGDGHARAGVAILPNRGPEPGLSGRGSLMSARQPFSLAPAAAFAPGRPDVGLFPFELWSRLQGQCWRNPQRTVVECCDPRGYPPLRNAIAAYLRTVRALNCTGDQVIITSGAQQGHDLAARVLLDPGDEAWCEDPGYGPAIAALAASGASVVPVPMDGSGISVEQGRKVAPMARLVSVAPSHQYPLGVVMSLARRLELLGWAAEANAWVVEDDYDSEFRYDGRPLASLQGLDRDGRVIYVGTFSKILLPSMRLGYIVVPDHAVEAFARARAVGDQHAPMWHQPVLARFIAEDYLASHLRRLRRTYDARQQAFLAARSHLDGLLDVAPDSVGIHLVGTLAPGLQARLGDVEAASRARRGGVYTSALSSFYAGPPALQGLLLGYACVAEAEMEARVRQLAAALRS